MPRAPKQTGKFSTAAKNCCTMLFIAHAARILHVRRNEISTFILQHENFFIGHIDDLTQLEVPRQVEFIRNVYIALHRLEDINFIEQERHDPSRMDCSSQARFKGGGKLP